MFDFVKAFKNKYLIVMDNEIIGYFSFFLREDCIVIDCEIF